MLLPLASEELISVEELHCLGAALISVEELHCLAGVVKLIHCEGGCYKWMHSPVCGAIHMC